MENKLDPGLHVVKSRCLYGSLQYLGIVEGNGKIHAGKELACKIRSRHSHIEPANVLKAEEFVLLIGHRA